METYGLLVVENMRTITRPPGCRNRAKSASARSPSMHEVIASAINPYTTGQAPLLQRPQRAHMTQKPQKPGFCKDTFRLFRFLGFGSGGWVWHAHTRNLTVPGTQELPTEFEIEARVTWFAIMQ